MPDKFDPYREALVMETNTIWPDEFGELDQQARSELETKLHADAENVAILEYVRTHSGFCRQITVNRRRHRSSPIGPPFRSRRLAVPDNDQQTVTVQLSERS